MESGETRNLSDYIAVLRRRWKLIVLVTILAGGIAFAVDQIRTASYEASTDLQFIDPGLQAGGVLGGGTIDYFPQNSAAAGAARITRADVLRDASRALGGDPSPSQLKDNTSTSVSQTNNLVTATVSSHNADQAAREANQLATSVQRLTRADARAFYVQRAKSFKGAAAAPVKARLLSLAAVAQPVDIVKPATAPGSPSSPKPLRDTLIALFLGLMLGIAAAFIRESLDRRASSQNQAKDMG